MCKCLILCQESKIVFQIENILNIVNRVVCRPRNRQLPIAISNRFYSLLVLQTVCYYIKVDAITFSCQYITL